MISHMQGARRKPLLLFYFFFSYFLSYNIRLYTIHNQEEVCQGHTRYFLAIKQTKQTTVCD